MERPGAVAAKARSLKDIMAFVNAYKGCRPLEA